MATETDGRGLGGLIGATRSLPSVGLHPDAIGMFVVGYDLEAGHLAQFVSKYPTKIIERPSTANGECDVLVADLVDKHVRLKIEVDRGHNYLIRRVTYLCDRLPADVQIITLGLVICDL